jgi:hypothetical protein
VIFDSTRSHASSPVLYIPNFCIAEVFSVFAKHAFGKWNRHVKKKKGTIDKRVYKSLVRQFGSDIHNGAFLNQYELSRYHILGIDLVAPVDHHYQISARNQEESQAGRHLRPLDYLDGYPIGASPWPSERRDSDCRSTDWADCRQVPERHARQDREEAEA